MYLPFKLCALFLWLHLIHLMSTSAIIAAKKRTENSLRNFQLPTSTQPESSDEPKKLNWSSSVFVKYRPDPIRQPKRTNNTRKKWPNMRYLGTCTLELGPHLFQDTVFYEASRGQAWSDIAREAGYVSETDIVSVPADTHGPDVTNTDNGTHAGASESEQPVEVRQNNATAVNHLSSGVKESTQPISGSIPDECTMAKINTESRNAVLSTCPLPTAATDTNAGKNTNMSTNTNTNASTNTNTNTNKNTSVDTNTNTSVDTNTNTNANANGGITSTTTPTAPGGLTITTISRQFVVPPDELVFSDVVMEFKETPNERFIFPKDVILELVSMQAPFELVASFLLPLNQLVADEYFLDPKLKLARFGEQSKLPKEIIEKAKEEAVEPPTKPGIDSYTPANIKMLQVDGDILKALVAHITKPDYVRQRMMEKMKVLPVRSYLRLTKSTDALDRSVEEMVHKAYTVPDIIAGPILAEKKRNEQLNAIKVGKRLRSENTEESVLPKSKHANIKDDGIRKCHYCSTKCTSMWRPGPEGSGTLCNGCGILWKQGKILKGAPVITREEEKLMEREARKKERLLQEQRERERLEQEKILLAKKAELARHRMSSDISVIATDVAKITKENGPKIAASRSNIGFFAAQLLQQQHQQTIQQKQQPSATQSKKSIEVRPQPAPPETTSRTTTVIAPQQTPLSLYSNAGIPLPTLSIDFGQMFFAHPNCGVTLVDGHFSIRLCKEGFPPTTLDIDKRDLQQASFDVITEGQLGREVLIMTCSPGGEIIERFNTLLIKPRESNVRIQFLEKLDPTGGAVVKRILERWLSALPTM
ncbi:hypothetical protein J3Q64DRAFT_1825719 [Phycomyces blakesleeanus]|uniref:GATA-type domain-containing protein n=1 Tax=Phycomyces blakesleeanus TaxID=4837 RepID=A0ABR3AJP6_PHYBL